MSEYPKFLLADPENVEDYRIVADDVEEAVANDEGYYFGGKAPAKKAAKAD